MKLKHNKKRNTAFLYEVLIRHLTKSIFEQNESKKINISNIIKNHFRKGSLLREELDVYNLVITKDRHGYHVAEKLIFEAKRAFAKIDKEKLFKEQTDVIKAINSSLGKDAYTVFIPNYKNLATVQQIFNDKTPIKTRVLLEAKIIHNLCAEENVGEDKMSPINNIVYKTFAKNFNKHYADLLSEEQKNLLNKYINSFSDNGLGLKIYLNEEVIRLREALKAALKKENILLQEDISGKIKEVLGVMDNFKKQEVDEKMIDKILKIQGLVREI